MVLKIASDNDEGPMILRGGGGNCCYSALRDMGNSWVSMMV